MFTRGMKSFYVLLFLGFLLVNVNSSSLSSKIDEYFNKEDEAQEKEKDVLELVDSSLQSISTRLSNFQTAAAQRLSNLESNIPSLSSKISSLEGATSGISKRLSAIEQCYSKPVSISALSPDPDTVLLLSMHSLMESPSAGDRIHDLSGHENHAVVVGSPDHHKGRLSSLHFDVNDHLRIPHSSSLNVAEITIEAWIRTATNTGYLLLKQHSYGFPKFLENEHVFSYIQLQARAGYEMFNVHQPTATDDNWHYFAMTYDKKTIRYYLDGVLSHSLVKHDSIHLSNDPILIGASGGWHTAPDFSGKLAAVRLSKRARSAIEIQHAYNMGKAMLECS